MKSGVPFHLVFECDNLNEYERMAMSVTLSEFEGNEFDWDVMAFKKRE
ncbi:hypothetical protein QN366_04820 [Pseudomonas sp. CCC3.2]|nr:MULTISPECIES: hypothetical protein [unclassified Pseudomonas]MEB0152798.1 hypothetical protein [Pseudomonas sp. CCC4.3]MDY7559964.1 hypothetical protein [Pseudomonas sp. AB6]MEB0085681.1 hypothetical protein [Pseudomonas sp. RTI1]MEB0179396.1 hypothetical protein [Pseudomonas sp. CCC3.2]MEB0210462.1 hypothetical protein [Pseudomonas sp. AB6]